MVGIDLSIYLSTYMKYDELYDWTNIHCYADSNMYTNISFPSHAVCMQFINDIIV